jgi:hypothetical protein
MRQKTVCLTFLCFIPVRFLCVFRVSAVYVATRIPESNLRDAKDAEKKKQTNLSCKAVTLTARLQPAS